jgi:hypothetical protein
MPRKTVALPSATNHTNFSSYNNNNSTSLQSKNKQNSTGGGGDANKRVQSYTRLLNAGFIKKEVFDNKVQQRSAPAKVSANTHQNNTTSSTKPPPLTHHHQSNNNSSSNSNHYMGTPRKTASCGINTHTSSNNPTSALAKHVLSNPPISNFSGQYPTNGAPGAVRH